GISSVAASRRPMEDFPAPIMPTSTIDLAASAERTPAATGAGTLCASATSGISTGSDIAKTQSYQRHIILLSVLLTPCQTRILVVLGGVLAVVGLKQRIRGGISTNYRSFLRQPDPSRSPRTKPNAEPVPVPCRSRHHLRRRLRHRVRARQFRDAEAARNHADA